MQWLSRILSGVASRCRVIKLRALGCKIEGPAWLRRIEVPRGHHNIALAKDVALDRGVTLLVSGEQTGGIAIFIGSGTYVNRHVIIDASEQIEIGTDVMIGPFVYITDHDHSVGSDGRPASGRLLSKPVFIGPRCWIGAHATILKGVTLGEGAVVGAGAVVTKDVPVGAVVVGNPAKTIKVAEKQIHSTA